MKKIKDFFKKFFKNKKLVTITSLALAGVVALTSLILVLVLTRDIKPKKLSLYKNGEVVRSIEEFGFSEYSVKKGETYSLNFDISPANAKDVVVTLLSTAPEVLSLSHSTMNGNKGTFVVNPMEEEFEIGVKIKLLVSGKGGETLFEHTHLVRIYEPIVLATPQELKYHEKITDSDASMPVQENVIAFKNVVDRNGLNVENYELTINGETVVVKDSRIGLDTPHNIYYKAFGLAGKLQENVDYEVSVRAMGDGIENATSEFSESVEFLKLGAPKNITNNGNIISWEENEFIDRGVMYEIKVVTINGSQRVESVLPLLSANTFELSTPTAGTYEVHVKTVYSGELNIFSSFAGNKYEIVKLKSISSPAIKNDRKESFGAYELTRLGLFSFSGVESASYYDVEVTPAISNEQQSTIKFKTGDLLNLEIDSRFESGVEYNLKITPKSENPRILNGNSVEFKFTKLSVPQNIKIENNKLTYNLLTGITRPVNYEIVVEVNGERRVINNGANELDLKQIATKPGTYKLYIKSVVQDKDQTGAVYANSEQFEILETFNKLHAPKVIKVENNSDLHFEKVDHAVSYDVYVNDILVKTVLSQDIEDLQNGILENLSAHASLNSDNKVYVLANGAGQNISNSQAEKVEFSFVKLQKVSNFKLLLTQTREHEVSWSSVSKAVGYEFSENNEEFRNVGNATKTKISGNSVTKVSVKAIGNHYDAVSSEIETFTFNKLENLENVKLENGILKFEYNSNLDYYLTIGTNNIKLTSGEFEPQRYLVTGQDQTVTLQAFPKPDTENQVSELFANPVVFTLNKLSMASGISVERTVQNYNNYSVRWQAVENIDSYRLILKDNASENSGTYDFNASITTYAIPQTVNDIVYNEGRYKVVVLSMGNSVDLLQPNVIGYVNSHEILKTTNSTNHEGQLEFVKLNSPQNVAVNGKIVSFSRVVNSIGYEINVTFENANFNKTYFVSGVNTTQFELNELETFGNYNIKVRAIGQVANYMTSHFTSVYEYTKLQTVQNVRIESSGNARGIISWDEPNENVSNISYDIYLIENEIEKLVETNYNLKTYNPKNLVSGVEYGIKIVSKHAEFITSEFSQEFKFEKLNNNLEFKIENGNFVWISDAEVSGYEIVKYATARNVFATTGATQSNFTIYQTINESTQNNFAFNHDANLSAGWHEFAIRKLGGGNLINGDYSQHAGATILTGVTNLRINEGVLYWNLNYTPQNASYNKPVKYKILVFSQDGQTLIYEEEVGNETTNVKLLNVNNGNFAVKVISVGDNSTTFDSEPVSLGVEKINVSDINLRLNKGIAVWNELPHGLVEYELYLDEVLVATTNSSSYDFATHELEVLKPYSLKLKAKAQGFITSNFSSSITIAKLPQVLNFAISKTSNSSMFTWSPVVQNEQVIASAYEIKPRQNVEQITFDNISALQQNQEFSITQPGLYGIKIRAIGSTGNSEINYLNSNYSSEINLSVLESVFDLTVNDNMLEWKTPQSYQNPLRTPDEFKVVVKNAQTNEVVEHTVNGNVKVVNLTTLPAGEFNVEVFAIGLENFKLNSQPASIFVEKANADNLNIRLEKGVIVWDMLSGSNTTYEIYLDNNLKTQTSSNSVTVADLVVGTVYDLQIKVKVSGMLTSNFSEIFKIEKLPQVSNFVVTKQNNKATLVWNSLANASEFELQSMPENEQLNAFVLGSNNSFEIELSQAGLYGVKIRAVGGTGKTQGVNFVTGDFTMPIDFSILHAPLNVRVENNLLVWSRNTNYNSAITSPDKFVITVKDVITLNVIQTYEVLGTVYQQSLSDLVAGTYLVEVVAKSLYDNKLDSVKAEKTDVVVLPVATGIRVENGIVQFNEIEPILNHDIQYEIYLNNKFAIKVADSSLMNLINTYITTPNLVYSLSIKTVSPNAISSEHTNAVSVSKLSSPTNLKINNIDSKSILNWTNSLNTNRYLILTGLVAEFAGLENYNSLENHFDISRSGVVGFEIPKVLQSGNHSFTMKAIGNTTSFAQGNEVGYLNSNTSNENVTFRVVDIVGPLRHIDGATHWNTVIGANRYLLEFYATTDVTPQTPIFHTIETTNNYFNISESIVSFGAGSYTIKVRAMGDEVNNFSTLSYSSGIFKVTPANTNFKVSNMLVNGLINVTLTQNMVKEFLTGSTSGVITESQRDMITDIIVGRGGTKNLLMLANFATLYDLEFTFTNGSRKFVRTSKPYQVIVNPLNNSWELIYDFGLEEGQYDVSIKGKGNTTHNLPNTPYLFAGKTITTAFNYTTTLTSKVLSVYQLSAPITPVPEIETSIYDNKIGWTIVKNNAGQPINNYILRAIPTLSGFETVNYRVNVSPQTANGDGFVFVNITDINENVNILAQPTSLVPGLTYSVEVIAEGNGGSSVGVVYNLTSRSSNSSEITLLLDPQQFKVINGVLTFFENSYAVNHIIKIWNATDNWESAEHDPENNLFKTQIVVNKNNLVSNLTYQGGIYYYNFQNNPDFPSLGENDYYRLTVQAVGDGISTISSNELNMINVAKWDKVTLSAGYAIDIENGTFKWEHVKVYNPFTSTYSYPENYIIKITRAENVLSPELVVTQLYSILDNHITITNGYVYLELPDLEEFSAHTKSSGTTIYHDYSIEVNAYGSIDGFEQLQFATGDSEFSKIGKRLDAPTDLRTVTGIVNWQVVNSASGYDVFVNQENKVKNGNSTEYEMTTIYNAGSYELKVRATASSGVHLNSRKSNGINAVKLETPKLRIENGEIKWNNPAIPTINAIATSTLLSIKGPVGFNANQLEGFNEGDFTVENGEHSIVLPNSHIANKNGLNLKGSPFGNYEITVKYIGSTGMVNSYYLVSSNALQMQHTKLTAPVIKLRSVDNGLEIRNIIEWNAVENATNYNVVAVKYDSDKVEVLNKFSFNSIIYGSYFTFNSQTNKFEFDLSAVNNYDNTHPLAVKFGGNYVIYVEALANNTTANDSTSKFSLSNNSNEEVVAIPVTPTQVQLDSYGKLTWVNHSNDTFPVVQFRYLTSNGTYSDYIDVILPAGQNWFKLTYISDNYEIKVRAILGTLEEPIGQSTFSNIVQGGFKLFESGSGQEIDPYIITNAKQLFNVNYYTHAQVHFKLGNNIDVTADTNYNEWTPIGVANAPYNIEKSEFNAVLDGDGFKISTIKFTNTYTKDLAFINIIGQQGVVKNIEIAVSATNIDVESFGGVAVRNYGLIDNVIVSGTTTLRQGRPDTYVGGVVTYNDSIMVNDVKIVGIIRKTINKMQITGATQNQTNTITIGGVAYRNNGNITQSGNEGKLTAISVAGLAYSNSGTVSESYNTGAINSIVQSGYNRGVYVAGLVATNNTGGVVTNSYVINNGNILITNNSNAIIVVGGLIGSNGSDKLIEGNYVVFSTNISRVPNKIIIGAIVGSNSISNLSNNHFQKQIGVVAVGNAQGSVAGVTEQEQNTLRSNDFVINYLGNKFVYVATGYPKLAWQI